MRNYQQFPGNAARFFVSGSDTEEFTYTPGSQLFYACLRSKNYVAMSIGIFADDVPAALKILLDLVAFTDGCFARYRSEYRSSRWLEGLRVKLTGEGEEADVDWTLTVSPMVPGIPFTIGWCGGDLG